MYKERRWKEFKEQIGSVVFQKDVDLLCVEDAVCAERGSFSACVCFCFFILPPAVGFASITSHPEEGRPGRLVLPFCCACDSRTHQPLPSQASPAGRAAFLPNDAVGVACCFWCRHTMHLKKKTRPFARAHSNHPASPPSLPPALTHNTQHHHGFRLSLGFPPQQRHQRGESSGGASGGRDGPRSTRHARRRLAG
jgi:hypothetical protein